MRIVANNRTTRLKNSCMTGFYAIARGLLKHAVSLKLGEPYLSWERFELGKEKGSKQSV